VGGGIVTARQEKVRYALRLLGLDSRSAVAALAEVEEWEARLERLAESARTLAEALDNRTAAYVKKCNSAEAAEAEADKLKAALTQITDAYTAEAEDHNDGEFALWKADDLVNAIVAARAALAPADPNTT
jgi:hypothetical protein